MTRLSEWLQRTRSQLCCRSSNQSLYSDEKEPLLPSSPTISEEPKVLPVEYRTYVTELRLAAVPADVYDGSLSLAEYLPGMPVWLILASMYDEPSMHNLTKNLHDMAVREAPWRWLTLEAKKKYEKVSQAISMLPIKQQDEILYAEWADVFWLDVSAASVAFYEKLSALTRTSQGFTAVRKNDVLNHFRYRCIQLGRKCKV